MTRHNLDKNLNVIMNKNITIFSDGVIGWRGSVKQAQINGKEVSTSIFVDYGRLSSPVKLNNPPVVYADYSGWDHITPAACRTITKFVSKNWEFPKLTDTYIIECLTKEYTRREEYLREGLERDLEQLQYMHNKYIQNFQEAY